MKCIWLAVTLIAMISTYFMGRDAGYHEAMDELKELWSKIQDVVCKASGVELEIREVVTTGDENGR